MSVPLNGCALSVLRCQGASATWPNCNHTWKRSRPVLVSISSSHFPHHNNLLLQNGPRPASIRGAQFGLDVQRAHCSRITVCTRTWIRVVCRRTQYNERSHFRRLCKNSNRHMWYCLFHCDLLGIRFDDQDKRAAELQMLMKHMSCFVCSQVCIWMIYFNNIFGSPISFSPCIQQQGGEKYWGTELQKDMHTDLDCEMNLHPSVWLTGYLDHRELFTCCIKKRKNNLRGFVSQTEALTCVSMMRRFDLRDSSPPTLLWQGTDSGLKNNTHKLIYKYKHAHTVPKSII